MSPLRYNPPYVDEQTAALDQGGCLSGFLIPPLTVMLLGVVMALILMGASPSSGSVALAADPAQSTADALRIATGDSLSTSYQASSGVAGAISQVFRPEVQYWSDAIGSWASKAGIDPNLVATVMQIESCGDPQARSGAGAMGLFQVMPYHFATGDNPYNPDTNATRGLAYLKRSLAAANGDPRLALAGYNGGIGVIGKPESTWSGQTQRYAYWGSGIYSEASNGSTVSSRLQEWYKASGGGLCRQASARLGINP